jgi:hypothetical protein
VEPGLEEDEDAGELVQADVLVQRQDLHQTQLPQDRDCVTVIYTMLGRRFKGVLLWMHLPKNEDENKHRV